MASERDFKIILIGDSGVGKTSFLIRQTESKFLNVHNATIGVDFKKIVVNTGKTAPPIGLVVWDTAGQERFRSIGSRFYRAADGVIIMFDVTSKSSFDSVPWWLNNARQHAPQNVPICLVGNKDENTRFVEVLEELVHEFVEENNLIFYAISVKDNINVDKVLHHLALVLQAEREKEYLSDEENERTRFFIREQSPDINKKKPCCSYLDWKRNSTII